jgi:hypothetical protein
MREPSLFAYRAGRDDALGKFGALVNARSILQEYSGLAAKYPSLTRRFPVPAVPSVAPSQEEQLLAKLRAGMARPSGAAEAHRAEAMARSGLLGQTPLLKVSDAIERDPLLPWKRKQRISEQWENLPKTGAAVPPGKLPFGAPTPKPEPHKFSPAAVSASRPIPQEKAPPTAALPSPLPPPSPNLEVAAGILGANAGQAVATHQKMGEWRLRPRAKLPLGQIAPDNGNRPLGTNFDIPRNGTTNEVSQAFNRMRVQRTSDPINLNALNEGLVPTIGI